MEGGTSVFSQFSVSFQLFLSIGANICSRQESQCLPYAGFFPLVLI